MTTTITTVQRTKQLGGIRRVGRGLWAALEAQSDRIAAWSAPYHDAETIGGEALSPEERLETALRWHARRGRLL